MSLKQITEHFTQSKNFIFFVCMYKMGQISKETYKKLEVEAIDNGRYFWINRGDLDVESDDDNWAQILDKCDLEKQKYRYELMPNKEFPPRRFVRNDLVEQKSCRKASKKFLEFKEKLGLDPNEITCDEQGIRRALQVAFEGEIILNQYYFENKRLMLIFLNTNLESKLMNMIIKAEILIMNKVDN